MSEVQFDGPTSGAIRRADGNFGVSEALRGARATLEDIAHALASYQRRPDATSLQCFHFDSRALCVNAYRAALAQVTERFWTTTFLNSGFWAEHDSDILRANQKVMRHLAGKKVATRRLFLLSLPPAGEVQRWHDERMLLGKYDDRDGMANFNMRFACLCANVESLLAHGCDIRVVYDGAARHHGLPPQIHFDHRDCELAIYDDWRFDLFRGGREGTIASVDAFTPVMRGFAGMRDQLVGYFEELWAEAKPVEALLERIRQAIHSSANRIDYHPNWLARYDHALTPDDGRLKQAELAGVTEALQRAELWGRVRHSLDVGTCTARYPISLRHAVTADGAILGIDNDCDAVRFALANVERDCPGDSRLSIRQLDFCAEDAAIGGCFDLITCMLGTVQHFPWEPEWRPGRRDGLQQALERFAELLAPDGLLFFSIWTEVARRSHRVLAIYSEYDKRLLADWNVGEEELESRLQAAGLQIDATLPLDDRMLLYRIRKVEGAVDEELCRRLAPAQDRCGLPPEPDRLAERRMAPPERTRPKGNREIER